MKLIDKDALVAEIERLRKNQRLDDRHSQGVLDGIHDIEKFINSLEVKEVDIDKEIERYCKTKEFTDALYTVRLTELIAKHFFELGLKAQK